MNKFQRIQTFVLPCLLLTPMLLAQAQQTQVQTAPKSNQDTASPKAIVSAFFESGSGPAGPRDFDRMRSLFVPGARVITIRRAQGAPATQVSRSIDEYIEEARKYLASNGNFETMKKEWVEQYANLGHVFCSFEARKSPYEEIFLPRSWELSGTLGWNSLVDLNCLLAR
jgi:hypothetical protein